MESQRKRIFRRILLFVLVFIPLIVFRLTTLDGVSQSRSSSFLMSSTPVVSPLCNVLPAEDWALKYVSVFVTVLSVNPHGSFIGTVPGGFQATGRTEVVIGAGKDILSNIKPGDSLKVALVLDAANGYTALNAQPIDQQTYAACKSNAIYFTTQAKQTADQQVVYWEDGLQILSFDPKQFPVTLDKPIQVVVQFDAKSVPVVLQACNA